MNDAKLSLMSEFDVQDLRCPLLRSTTRWTGDAGKGAIPTYEGPENDDFLAILTCATGLYAQEHVLPMSTTGPPGEGVEAVDGQGAVGLVTRLHADYALPSNQQSNKVDKMVINCAAKRYVGGGRDDYLGSLVGGSRSKSLWDKDGNATNIAEARSFVMELRVLSHPDIRNCGNVVEIRGLGWDNLKASLVSHVNINLLTKRRESRGPSSSWSAQLATCPSSLPSKSSSGLMCLISQQWLNRVNLLSALHHCPSTQNGVWH